MIKVNDVSGDDTRPAGICWEQSPQTMERCTYSAKHQSYHSWAVATQPWYQKLYAWALRRSEKVDETAIGKASNKAADKVIGPLVK